MAPREFAQYCVAAEVGQGMGLGGFSMEALEDLHRLRIVVPLLTSPKGTNDKAPLAFGDYMPWKSFGHRGDEGGWIEVYYHPFQLLLVDYAEDLFQPVSRTPGGVEKLAAMPSTAIAVEAQHAQRMLPYARTFAEHGRVQRFYRVLPYLILADQIVGPSLRRRFRGQGFVERRGRTVFKREYPAWWRWRRFVTSKLRDILDPVREQLTEEARELWRVADFQDPLRGWNDLVAFVSWDAREKLRGRALAAHRFKEMALLLAGLLSRAYGEKPHAILEPGSVNFMQTRLGGPLDPTDHSQLELIANRFGVNPTPAVLWFVEGESELAALTRLEEARPDLLGAAGVRVLSLRGTGGLKHLPKTLEAATTMGVTAFILADKNDAGVAKAIHKLVKAGAIARDRVLYSDPSFERLNFSNSEIADTMNEFLKEVGTPAGASIQAADMNRAIRWGRLWCGAITGCEQALTCRLKDGRVSGCPFVVGCTTKPRPRFVLPKAELAERLITRYVLPEIGQVCGTSRRIVDQLQEVLDAAAHHRSTRPTLHISKDRIARDSKPGET